MGGKSMFLKILKYSIIDVALTWAMLLVIAYVNGRALVNAGYVLMIFFPLVFTISYFYTSMLIKLRVNLFMYLVICGLLTVALLLAYLIFPVFLKGYESTSVFIVIQFTLIYFFLREVYAMPAQ